MASPREPGTAGDLAYGKSVAAFVAAHTDLLAAERWEDPYRPPVREALAAAGAAGLFRGAWWGEGSLYRSVQLHAALAHVGNGAPGAAVLTHLEVGARLLHKLAASPELVEQLLDGTTTAALAVTEPGGGGSDLSNLFTKVGRDADGLTVTGEKWFISNAPYADLLLVLADDPDEATSRRPGPALLLVEATAPGVRIEPVPGSGHTGLTGRIVLTNAPVGTVLAPAGHGLLRLARHWIHERVMLAVRMTEMASAVLDHAVSDARERRTFGASLMTNQHVRFVLAGLSAEIEEVRAATRHGVRLLTSGQCGAAYAATCKYRASTLLRQVADEALQFAGADAYRTGHPAERALRDGLGLALAGGTDELMLMQIERG